MHPSIQVYDGNRKAIIGNYTHEPLAQLDCPFSVEGGSAYYVQVAGVDGTSGPYVLLIKPLKRVDRFEPNDDFLQAKSISVGGTIEANIMDNQDQDFYLVKASGAGQLTARFENSGTTLRPSIQVYDGNRKAIIGNYSHEPLAQLDCPFPAQGGASYYIQITGVDNTSGPYKLTVK